MMLAMDGSPLARDDAREKHQFQMHKENRCRMKFQAAMG
jgi:hypothetical protein